VDQPTGPGGGGPQGADVGSTALHLAAGAGHLPVVKMLVRREPDHAALH
jgi:ankyrin repeat protein